MEQLPPATGWWSSQVRTDLPMMDVGHVPGLTLF